ncbi:MAG: polymer-forming cytoskeletal protein [Gammaproteobacteria bacterium]|nr:polymer-forming cytoskeletal protein [Gammaproteobacteria bacterium]
MFHKRDTHNHEVRGSDTPAPAPAPAESHGPSAAAGRSVAASIGPSISIQGELRGEEDLVVEGKFKGTVQLKKNTLTVGAKGSIDAEVYAHTILVDGTVNGDLYASERISIRKTARITGNIFAPRISLEDGARFRGTIDMDTENEAFRKAFGTPAASSVKPATPAERPVAEAARNAQAPGKSGSGTHG